MDPRRRNRGRHPDPAGSDPPHDVLAAEEFVIGTRDERWPADPTGIHEAHDVLAAEEFAMPAPDDRWPADPSGIREPHDVLAAEEFAMPTSGDRHHAAGARGGRPLRRLAVVGLTTAAALVVLARRRS